MDYRNFLRQQVVDADGSAAAAAASGNGDGSPAPADDDYEYQPPTEAQLKVMKARRERSDKIAKRMGECLLMGWRMLDRVCPQCDTILMMRCGETDGDATYCISCRELESDVSKDDPAQSAEAARTQARESEEAARATATAKAAATVKAKSTVAADPLAGLRASLRAAALDRLEFYRHRLVCSTEPRVTGELLDTMGKLMDFLDRVGATE